jgi:nucleotide-binding universal stress UspA family protein
MGERILVPYDGTALADEAVEKAIDLARTQEASLYVLAIAPGEDEQAPSMLSVAARLTDDLMTFARLGAQLGIDIDGSYLDAPTEVLLRAIIETHRINRVIMALDRATADASRNGRLLKALAENCPVPVTVLA